MYNMLKNTIRGTISEKIILLPGVCQLNKLPTTLVQIQVKVKDNNLAMPLSNSCPHPPPPTPSLSPFFLFMCFSIYANNVTSACMLHKCFFKYSEKVLCYLFHFIFNWDSLHARLNSHDGVWRYKKKKHNQITARRKSVQKEPTIKSCLLILDLKPKELQSLAVRRKKLYTHP